MNKKLRKTLLLILSLLAVNIAAAQQSLPYVEDFESYPVDGFPTGWTRTRATTWSTKTYPTIYENTNDFVQSGTHSLILYGGPSNYNIVCTPRIAAPGNALYCEFYFHGGAGTTLEAGVMTDSSDINTFMPLATAVRGFYESGQTIYFYTDGLSSTGRVFIAFRWGTNSDNTDVYGYIDDLKILSDNGCHRPTALATTNVGWNDAMLHWTDGGTMASQYEVCYSTSADMTASLYDTTNTTNIVLQGLQSATTYYAWVRAICSTGNSAWCSLGSFTTAMTCVPIINATVDVVAATSVGITWQYNQGEGRVPSGAVVEYTDLVSSATNRITTSNAYIFLNNLTTGHQYKASIRQLCGSQDTASAVEVFFTPMTIPCAQLTGSGLAASSTYSYPLSSYHNYSYSQVLYPASIISQGTDTITGIGLWATTTSSYAFNFDIWIDTTSATTLSAAVGAGTMKHVVVNRSMVVTNTGWVNIPFDTVFRYSGNKNIIITFDNNTGSRMTTTGDCVKWGYHSKSVNGNMGNLRYYNNNNNNIDPYTLNYNTSNSTMYFPDIRFYGNCNSGDCNAPNVMIGDVDTTKITIAWTPGNNDTAWVVQIRPSSATDWDTSIYTTRTIHTFANLLPTTEYVLRVGSLCGNDTLFADSISTYTDCPDYAAPYHVSFASSIDRCWNIEGCEYNTSAMGMNMNKTFTSTHLAISPRITTPLNTLQVRVLARNSLMWARDNYHINVGVCNADGSSLQWIDSIYPDHVNLGYAEYIVSLARYTGNAQHIVLGGGTSCFVQAVDIENIETCFPVDSLQIVAGSIHADTVALTWKDTISNHWEIEYSNNDGQSWLMTDSYLPNIVLRGLNASSDYRVRVRAACSNTDYSRWKEVAFRSECGIATLPWMDGFESNDLNASPSCWTAVRSYVGSRTYPLVSNTSVHSGTKALYLWSNSTNAPNLIATPYLAMPANELRIRFYASYSDSANFEVGVMSDVNNPSTYTRVWSAAAGSGNNRVRAYEITTESLTISDTVSVAFYSPVGDKVFIDDVSITHYVPCPSPSVLALTSTDSSITIMFSQSDTTELFLTDSVTTMRATTYGNHYTFTGLNPLTEYTIGLRSSCVDENYSLWTIVYDTTDAVDCPSPQGLHVDSVAYTRAAISWNISNNVAYYQVHVYGPDKDTLFVTNSSSLLVDDLTYGNIYYAAVRSVCRPYADFVGEYGDTIRIETELCYPVANVAADSITTGSAIVRWIGNTNRQVRYAVQYGIQDYVRGREIATDTVADTFYVLTGLEPSTTYDFYVVKICTDTIESEYSLRLRLTTDSIVDGITIATGKRDVAIYPNPARERVRISCSHHSNITITDFNGRTMEEHIGVEDIKIDVSTYAKGTYFIKVVSNDACSVRKLIVQ